ncbi:MAG: transcriptional regulator [Pseudomonadota bacterium]
MSKTACIPFDPAEFIDAEDDVVAYLNAVIEDGDPSLLVNALSVIARVRRVNQKPGTAAAVDLDIVDRALAGSGTGPMALGDALAAIKALGVKLQVARY